MASPLRFEMTAFASSDWRKAVHYLGVFGEEVELRWEAAFSEEIKRLCQNIADQLASQDGVFDQPDEGASLQFARPVFQQRFQTGRKKVRRSSAGVWRIFYALDDDDKDGQPDTLRVYAIRHAASKPFPDFEDEAVGGE